MEDIHLRKMWPDREKQHAVLQPLKCKYCPWRFFYQISRYLAHMRNHKMRWYNNPRLRCCPKVLPSKLLDEQPRTLCKHLEGTLFCSGGISTENQQQVDAHVRNFRGKTYENAHTKKYKYYELSQITCLICSKKFSTAREDKNLEKCEHMLQLRCRFCGRYFNTLNWKTRHEKYAHVCEFCGLALGSVQAKKFHKLNDHSSEKHNKCYNCGRYLPKHSHDFAQSYACEICSKLITSLTEIEMWDKRTVNQHSINARKSANGQSVNQQSIVVGRSTISPSINRSTISPIIDNQKLTTKPLYPTDHDYAQFGSPYPPYFGIAIKTPLNKIYQGFKGTSVCR